MPKKQSTKKRKQVKDLPVSEGDMRKVKGGELQIEPGSELTLDVKAKPPIAAGRIK